jgi:hypothetical protein
MLEDRAAGEREFNGLLVGNADNPDKPRIYVVRGQAYEAIGEKTLAADNYRTAASASSINSIHVSLNKSGRTRCNDSTFSVRYRCKSVGVEHTSTSGTCSAMSRFCSSEIVTVV